MMEEIKLLTIRLNDALNSDDIEPCLEIVRNLKSSAGEGFKETISGIEEKLLSLKENFSQQTYKEASNLVEKLGRQEYMQDEEYPKHKEEEFSLSKDSDPEILRDFITESRENLQLSEEAILKLESNPQDSESVNKVFRAFHTIKGTSSFVSLNIISEFSHHAENMLSRIRDGKAVFNSLYADLSLKAIDVIKEILIEVEKALDDSSYKIKKPVLYDDIKKKLSESEFLTKTPENKEEKPAAASLSSPRANETAAAFKEANADKVVEESTIRIKTDKLDRLIDTVGELSISYSMLLRDIESIENSSVSKKSQQTEKIVRELQELAMSMRMVPIKNMFAKMIRLARDLSRKTEKKVSCRISGEETEIDRNMINIVEELLIHMVRNSIDHGIETPSERESKGKNPEGNLSLRAYNADGNVVFEIEDDGRGLDTDKIRKKAVEKNLIRENEELSELDTYNLIFLPGFSTADKITDVSGRGVGMDVVKRGIDSLRGKIEISSQKGKGTIFKMKFPLTMAVTDGMLVKVCSDKYVIPVNSVKILAKASEGKLYSVNSKEEIFSLRGDIMPVFRLNNIFSRDSKIEKEGIFVIVEDRGKKSALWVEEVLGKQQVVAKPLPGIKSFPGILGGCILGDGRVAVIIEPQNIIDYYRSCKRENSSALS